MTRLALLLVGLSVIAGIVYSSPNSVVSPSLLSKVSGGQKANITIIISSPVSKVFAQYHGKSYPQRGQLMTAMRQHLIDYTAETQALVQSFLKSKGVSFKAYWITNRIFVKNAEEYLILELASTLQSRIEEIREEVVAQLFPIEPVKMVDKTTIRAPVRGVHTVGAPQMWQKGNTGENMTVANIDTGVRGTHEALAPNFLGEYGWYDPAYGSQVPEDQNGHGTHTMGTIAGQDGFGVAPGARWIACVGCQTFGCWEGDLIGCAQFTSCPHHPDGSNADCSKAPHVCSNSWGSTAGGQDWYDDAIEGMKMAGIIVVFSAGNSGSSCSTVGSPGDRPGVIGVAATDFNDKLAYFSSRGPEVNGSRLAKPEISAPGVDVLSAWNSGDDAYSILSGTSMSSPHVAGGIALLFAEFPEHIGNYEAITRLLYKYACKDGLDGDEQICGGVPDYNWPNYLFGYGRLDIPRSAGIN